jgi:hypothetical protein
VITREDKRRSDRSLDSTKLTNRLEGGDLLKDVLTTVTDLRENISNNFKQKIYY